MSPRWRGNGTASLLVVAAFAVLPVAKAESSAEATPAIVVERGGQLYAIAVNGSRRTRLTRVPPTSGPALSPDGSLVAFARRGGGITTMRLDGSRRRVVTRGSDDSPTWTSDGRTLYFVRRKHVGYGDCGAIFAVAASGGAVRRITNPWRTEHTHENPAVSPDGSRIAFSDWNACEGGTASPRLRVVDTRGRPTSDLTRLRRNRYYPDPEHSSPEWSPDGSRIAYRWEAELAVANRDGSGERRIVRGGRGLIYEPPEWSPDGRWIAFTRYRRAYALLVVRPDGGGLRRIARAKSNYSLAGWLPTLPN